MGKDTDQIKREIEDARERMGAAADAIGFKADVPARTRENIGDTIDGVRDAIGSTAAKVTRRGGKLAHAMIENPLGIAL